MRRLLALLASFAACGGSGASEKVAPKRQDGGTQATDASVTLAPLALGMPEVAGFDYRARAGHAAFKLARDSEAKGDWATVAAETFTDADEAQRSAQSRYAGVKMDWQRYRALSDSERREVEVTREFLREIAAEFPND